MAKEEAYAEFENKREEMRRKDEQKTGKNRKRREKRKGKDGKEGTKVEAEHKAMRVQQDRRALLDLKPSGNFGEDEIPASAVEEVGVIIHDDE